MEIKGKQWDDEMRRARDIASVSSQIIECQRRVNPGMDVNEAEAQVKDESNRRRCRSSFQTHFLLEIFKAGGPVEQKAPGAISRGGTRSLPRGRGLLRCRLHPRIRDHILIPVGVLLSILI